MKPYLCAAMIAIATCAFAALPRGHAGGKAQPILPADAYKELSERSVKSIMNLAAANAKGARERINVEAAILAAYTLAVKNPNDERVAQVRGAALAAPKTDVKKLAQFGAMIPSAAKTPADIKLVKVELADLMKIFFTKAKGGEGISTDLQYQTKLKNLNGSEALIGALATKKLNDENMNKVANELPKLAYRTAVVASITHEFTPKNGVVAQWRDLSVKMRDASFELARAATKKNAAGVFQAAQALENSCTDCHRAFKAK